MSYPLRKRYVRELRSNFGRYLAIFLMLATTIALMSGFLSVSDGIQAAFYEDREKSNLEDGLLTSKEVLSKDVIQNIKESGVNLYSNFYLDAKIANDKTLRIYEKRKKVDLVTVMSGRMPEGMGEIALERLFAKSNKIAIGDIIHLYEKDWKVTGFVCMPDYSSLFEKNSDLMMDSFSFGVGIVDQSVLKKMNETQLIWNYSFLFRNQDLTKGEKRSQEKQLLENLVKQNVTLTNFCTAENNNSISFVEDDLASDVPLMKTLMNIIIVIMAFVFAVVISNTIDTESAIIGTLLASGYSKNELIRHYLGLPLLVTGCSALVGNIIGYTWMPEYFKMMFYDSYSLPPMKISLNGEALLLTTALPILIMIVINVITLRHKLSLTPLSFLRRELKKGKGHGPRKLPPLSFFNRFRLRIIIQNRNNYIVMLVGIFFASVILMFGLCMNPLINHYVDSIKETSLSKYQYLLKTPELVPEATGAEDFTFSTMETFFKAGKKNIEVSFYGIKEQSDYLKTIRGSEQKEGIYLSDGLAKKLNRAVGDQIQFKDPYSGKKYRLPVIGIQQYSAGLAVFMNQNQLNELLNKDDSFFNGYFSNEKMEFRNEANLVTVITPKDMVEIGDQMTSSFSQLAPLCLGIALIIYFVLLYILTKIVIDKNTIPISYMKVFGYNEKEIQQLYLSTTTIVVMVSFVFCLPLVYVTIKQCFEAVLIKISGYIPVYIPFYLYFEIVGFGMVTYLVINYFHKKKLNRIKLTDALKSRE